MNKKNLLVFAHRGEAQAFIDDFRFLPVNFFFNGLFKNETDYLLLCGEGPQSAGEKTTAVLAVFHLEIDRVVNLGIAGSLTPKLKTGDLAWIRSSYAQNAERCEFKSWTMKDNDGIDCITAFSRITAKDQKQQLSAFADLVDRELWSIASAAHLFKRECLALKLVSDDFENKDKNKDEVSCELIKSEAPKLSQALLLAFKSKKLIISIAKPTGHKIKLEEWTIDKDKFYFTVTQERMLCELINGLTLKGLISGQAELDLIMKNIIESNPDKVAKDMTKELIIFLSERLNPLKKRIKEKINLALKPLLDAGIQTAYDPELESSEVTITHRIKSAKDQKRMLMALENFNYQKIKDVFEGKFE